jgi:hypothetical protein
MSAACVIGLLMASAVTSTAHAGNGTKAWEQPLTVPFTSTEDGPAVEGAAGACYFDGKPIKCTYFNAWWNGWCYAALYSSDPNDPDTDKQAEWLSSGKTDGVLMVCLADEKQSFADPRPYWSETEDRLPSLEELADEAYLVVKGIVTAPDIGVFPGGLADGHPKASGLVGVPTWFWAESPGPGVGSPDTKSTEVKGYTLEATASFMKTVYDTGDGHTVTCDLGSAPVNVRKPTNSPTGCEHTYMERGTYTIKATTYVEVEWSGAHWSGRLELSVDRSGVYRVAENQVVIVSGP